MRRRGCSNDSFGGRGDEWKESAAVIRRGRRRRRVAGSPHRDSASRRGRRRSRCACCSGPGAVRPAAAGSLTIGAGSTVQLGDGLLNMGCNDLIVEPEGTLQAQAGTIASVGVFDNQGTFAPGTGTVLLCSEPSPPRGPGGGEPSRSDSDRDGVPAPMDNCPNDVNPDQADADGDGVGDACDNCPGDSTRARRTSAAPPSGRIPRRWRRASSGCA